jgi:cytochrome c
MVRNSFIVLALLAGFTLTAQAAGDPKAGADIFRRCAQCHTDDKGGGDGLGPNLFGVLGRKAASRPGFSYSAALKQSGITWTPDNLIKWVTQPQRMVPGTKMSFAGLSSKTQQANVVAYLATLK